MNTSAISSKDTHRSLRHSIASLRVFTLCLPLFQVLFKVQVSQEYLKAGQLFELLIRHSLLSSVLITLHILGSSCKLRSFLTHHIYSLITRLRPLLLLIDHHPQDQI